MKAALITIIASAGIVFSAPAQAGEFAFHYKASELSTSAGANAVYSRLRVKAAAACGSNEFRLMTVQYAAQVCANDLVTNIVGEIDAANLSAVHARAGGGRSLGS